VRSAAEEACEWRYSVHFSHEPEILGSGGGIWQAREHLYGDGNFVIANGDSVFFLDSLKTMTAMFDYHKRTKALATLLVCPLPGIGETRPGVWFTKGRDVVTFGNASANTKELTCRHYAGIIFFSDRIFDVLPAGSSNILYDVLQKEIAKGEIVNVWEEEMKWYETGKPRDFFFAANECLDMLFSPEGVRWHIPDILDRFTPGWRNHTEDQMFGYEKPNFPYNFNEGAKVLFGRDIVSKTAIHFDGHTILNGSLDLSGRAGIEGIYLSKSKMWIR
jgi:NDP-sugar pyrophosphorylase family protein